MHMEEPQDATQDGSGILMSQDLQPIETEATDLDAPKILRNMSWWGSCDESLLLNQASTLEGTPSRLGVAIAEAREAVAQYILAATSVPEEERGWKCFLAFDRMLFAELQVGTSGVQAVTVNDRVAVRLHDFWAGS